MTPYPGNPNYAVTEDGRVFRIVRSRFGRQVPYELKPHSGRRGYLTVAIDKRTTPIHRLVAGTFLQNPECKPEVAHADGDRHNNARGNLRWATRKENEDDKLDHGTLLHGEQCPWRKLSEQDVREIRRLRQETSLLQKDVAEQFGVSRRLVGKICKGQRWAHVS